MKIIAGQFRDYTGDVFIGQCKMPDREALLSIGYAPQPISLYKTLTARENLRFLVDGRLSDEQIAARSDIVLNQTGLAGHAEDPVGNYLRRDATASQSGGGDASFAEAPA